MRTLITLFLLSTFAIGQEGIPANFGGDLPPGLAGETDLNAIKQRRIEALQGSVEALRARYLVGNHGSSFLHAAEIELAIAKLDSTTVKKERLDHIQTALTSALLAWQQADARQKVGAVGDETECQTRAAVFKFRAMWLAEKAAGPQQTSPGQEIILANVGNGVLPPGLDGETDLNVIKQRRIGALQGAVEALGKRFRTGRDDINFMLTAQIELVIAKLDSTTIKKERLDHIESALTGALVTWQRVDAERKTGQSGPAPESKTRAAVFRFLAMWLAEKAAGPKQTSNGLETTLANVGNGLLPQGLEGETDINVIKQRRIESLVVAVTVLEVRSHSGLGDTNFLLAAQIELAIAMLESTTVKRERLDHIESALSSALKAWQTAEARQKNGQSDETPECQTRAVVFKFRAMWLAEKAADPQSLSVVSSHEPQYPKVATSLLAEELNSYPFINNTRPSCWITETQFSCPTTYHRANHRWRRYRP